MSYVKNILKATGENKMRFSGRQPSRTLLFFLTLSLLLALYYYITTTTLHHPLSSTPTQNDQNTLNSFIHTFLSSASNATVAAYLRRLTLHPHLAGTPPSLSAALYVRSHFQSLNFPTHLTNFSALLSFPKPSPSPSLTLHFPNATALRLPLSEPEVPRNGVVLPYHAYSPSGSAYGPAVFLNYGRDQDYAALRAGDVDVRGCVGIVRRGSGMSRYEVVENAAVRGLAAVVMYTEGVYREGVERGTVMKGLGDPLSPGWAGVEGGERLELGDPRVTEKFPGVPSLPVSEAAAERILGTLEGRRVPYEWRESFKSGIEGVGPGPTMVNFTYEVGLLLILCCGG